MPIPVKEDLESHLRPLSLRSLQVQQHYSTTQKSTCKETYRFWRLDREAKALFSMVTRLGEQQTALRVCVCVH